MVEKVKTRISIEASTLEQFLSERLKRYIKDMTRLERSNLYETVMNEIEKALIKLVLEATEGNQVKAAKTLGISRNTLRNKIRQYRICNSTGSTTDKSGKKKKG